MSEPFETTDDLVDAHIAWMAAIVRDDAIAEAARVVPARVQATRRAGIELPLFVLESRLALSETEMRVLWLLLAHELDPTVRIALRAASSEQVADVTFDVLRQFVYGNAARSRAWRELEPGAPLRSLGLIQRTDGTAEVPEQRQTFKVARRVLALAHDDLQLDPDLAGIARIVESAPALDGLELDPRAVEQTKRAVARGTALVLVHGRAGSGRRLLLSGACGSPTLVVDARALAPSRDEVRRQLRMIAREARLFGCVPLITNLDALCEPGPGGERIDLVEQELHGLVLATNARPLRRRWAHPVVQIELPPLASAACARVWSRSLGLVSESDANHLATMYPMTPALIVGAGRAAHVARGDEPLGAEHIQTGIRSVLDDRLSALSTRVTVSQTWDDLVLPDDQLAGIIELLARIRERRRVYEEWGFAEKLGRGLGTTALFSGPPGTGKTMAAGLIARDLGCELYQVDTSKITSKWIGETEKNLATLFDAAEAGHAILLFDEADTLFGKRTDVKSSNDRHANQEVNYLLQRIESYRGICILTTNHESALDEAFRRRLSLHVRFPMPEADERVRLWRALLPSTAPTAGQLGLDSLAETFAMSGGHIRNAVVRAAFLAADEDVPIDAAHLVRAARLEYEAMGKVAPSLVNPVSSARAR